MCSLRALSEYKLVQVGSYESGCNAEQCGDLLRPRQGLLLEVEGALAILTD